MICRTLLLLGLAVALTPSAHAQAVGRCTTGTAQRFIASSSLRVSVFNTGALFFGGSTTSGDGYLIPKQARTQSPILATGLWLGGRVDGQLRVAAARYGNWNFWPGPLEDAASPPTDCSEHDRIYVVSREDIRRYYQTGELTDDLRDWPHQFGAPVIDGDGDSTNYDLRAGDQPDLIGDMAAWWVMNDAGNAHPAQGSTAPMGVEVRVLAFVYGMTQSSPVLDRTSFYRYEIINRGDQPIEEMYATLWADVDLGGAGDDYMGADTLRNMVFVYNSDERDSAYGIPPSLGFQILEGPVGLANGRDDDSDGEVDEPGERLGATVIGTYIGGGPAGTQDPGTGEAYYNYMKGLWGDGLPRTAFGQGYQTDGPVTTFSYPGDPVTGAFWSERNIDGNGTASSVGDRVMFVSTGPFQLGPGSTTTLFYAMPFGHGADWLNSIEVMRGYASSLQAVSAQGFFISRRVDDSRLEPRFELALSRVRPNPSGGAAEVVLTLPAEAHTRATVHDTLGRELAVLADGLLLTGETALPMPDGLAPGTYLLRVRVEPGGEETLTFTVAR